MLNSSTLSINNSPIFFVDNNIANYPSDDITNPYSKNEESPYSTSYFPLLSPLIYNDFAHFDDEYNYPSNDEVALIQQMVESNTNSSIITEESASLEVTTTNKMNSDKKDEVTGIVDDIGADKILESNAGHGLKRRRTSNRDRHSKIRTAHGLRDRRMRLSLEVARKFFKLQDILGYDKASNTIEWLLTQSKPAIEELLQSKNGSPNGVTKCTISSTSDCEVESTVVERRMAISKGKKASTCVGKDTKQPKKKRMMISKEARKEKRENARVKAFEKMISRMVTKDSEKSTFLNHLTLGACEVIQKYNDPLPTLSCNQNVVTSSRRSTLSILNFDEKVNIAQ